MKKLSINEQLRILAEQASEKTNKDLDKEICIIGKLSKKEIKSIAPTAADKLKLTKLMAIVKENTNANQRSANLTNNMGELGEVLFRVLRKTLV